MMRYGGEMFDPAKCRGVPMPVEATSPTQRFVMSPNRSEQDSPMFDFEELEALERNRPDADNDEGTRALEFPEVDEVTDALARARVTDDDFRQDEAREISRLADMRIVQEEVHRIEAVQENAAETKSGKKRTANHDRTDDDGRISIDDEQMSKSMPFDRDVMTVDTQRSVDGSTHRATGKKLKMRRA